MNQVAALLVPTVLPQAAGIVAPAANAAASGNGFADILLQLQSLLAGVTPAAGSNNTTPAPSNGVLGTSNVLDTQDIQAQINNLLGNAVPPAQNASDTPVAGTDATLATQLAAFQLALQSIQTQPPAATDHVAPAAAPQLVTTSPQFAAPDAPVSAEAAAQPAKASTDGDVMTPLEILLASNPQIKDAAPVATTGPIVETPKPAPAKPAAKIQDSDGAEQPRVAVFASADVPMATPQIVPQIAPEIAPQTAIQTAPQTASPVAAQAAQVQVAANVPVATTAISSEQPTAPEQGASQLGLRGTIAPSQDAAPQDAPAQPQTPKEQKLTAEVLATVVAAQTAVTPPAKPTNSPAPALATAKPLAAPKRAAAAEPLSNSPAENAKTTEAALDNATASTSASTQTTTTIPATPAHKAETGATPPLTTTPSPVLPSVITAEQFTAAPLATPQAVPLDMLAVHMARKLATGSSEFEISLHPADLGKLEISLSVAGDGQVQASIRAERPETLELLQRDSRALEQQLRQAGLDVGSNALSFSLSNGNNGRPAPFTGWPAFAGRGNDEAPSKEVLAANYVAVRMRGGIDIQV